MFPDLAALLFMSRDYGHKAHLRTQSHAVHVTLNDFYVDLTKAVDALVEAYQGRNGLIDIPPCEIDEPSSDPITTLRKHLKIVEEVRGKAVNPKDTPVNSLLDDICVIYLSTLYKLENLK